MVRMLLFRLFVLSFLVATPLISGCGGIPVSAHPTGKYVDVKEAKSSLGFPIQNIYDRFGEPSFVLLGADKNYYIYASTGEFDLIWDVFLPYLLIPAELYGELDWAPIFCAIFETDNTGYVKRFDSDWSTYYLPSGGGEALLNLCLHQLRTKEEVNQIKADAKEYLHTRAEQGDKEAAVHLAYGFGLHELQNLDNLRERARLGEPDAQWELYQKYPTDENIVWLCRAADQGDRSARNEIGQLYLYGSEQYRKFENVHIAPDIPRSCMWFHLAEKAQITEPRGVAELLETSTPYESAELDRTANAMTDKELAKAEELILAWEPGQCERDLFLHPGEDHSKRLNMVSLCKAADYGDFSARDELGQIYFFGFKGIKPDIPRAFMWYHLAAIVYKPPSLIVGYQQSRCDAMTPEQRSIAVKYLKEWEPGKCEKDLLQ